jgi:hypothetical protein
MKAFAPAPPRPCAKAETKPNRVYACFTNVKKKHPLRVSFFWRWMTEGVALSSNFQEIFRSQRLYSVPSLCFSAAGAIAGMLLFWIKPLKEARSLD